MTGRADCGQRRAGAPVRGFEPFAAPARAGRLCPGNAPCVRLQQERPTRLSSCHVVQDQTHDGRRIEMPTVIDGRTRECRALAFTRRRRSDDVPAVPVDLFVQRCPVGRIGFDNGSDFTTKPVRDRFDRFGVEMALVQRGCPWAKARATASTANCATSLPTGRSSPPSPGPGCRSADGAATAAPCAPTRHQRYRAPAPRTAAPSAATRDRCHPAPPPPTTMARGGDTVTLQPDHPFGAGPTPYSIIAPISQASRSGHRSAGGRKCGNMVRVSVNAHDHKNAADVGPDLRTGPAASNRRRETFGRFESSSCRARPSHLRADRRERRMGSNDGGRCRSSFPVRFGPVIQPGRRACIGVDAPGHVQAGR